MSDYSGVISEIYGNAASTAVADINEDPDKAMRAMELSDATGAAPTTIYGDIESFERNHKAAMASNIISSNQHISDYVNSHTMAAKISNDDYGQLDAVTSAVQKHNKDSILASAIRGFGEGFGEGGLGSWISAEDKANHPLLAAEYSVLGSPIEGFFRIASGAITAAVRGVQASVVTAGMDRDQAAKYGDYAIHAAGDPGLWASLGPVLHTVGAPFELAARNAALKEAAKVEPYAREGKAPPVGVSEGVDAIHAEQAKVDADTLSAALKEATKSATRERNPDLFANFIRQHTNDEIGISADAIRKLYGDKPPAPNDGVLGWVPGLQERLAAAEATGGDVKIPLADYLAKVDPSVAKELQDHVRIREGGMTVEEAKELSKPEGEALTPIDTIRQAAGLEGIQERKLTLERGQDVGEARVFSMKDTVGKVLGEIYIAEEAGGKRLYIDDIRSLKGPQSLGPRAMRDVLQQLKEQFPNAETLEGMRVSGARDKAGIESAKDLKAAIDLTKIKPRAPKQLELPQDAITRLEDREVFAKANAIGMTVDQYKRYQSLIEKRAAEDAEAANKRILEDQRKRQSAEWKANRAELRPQVNEEILARVDHELDDMLQNGRVKLRADSLTPEQRAALPKSYIAADGIHPDDLAGLFGDHTGSSVVDQLVGLVQAREASGMRPKAFFERVVDAETDRLMEARYGKLDRNIIEEAKDQVLSETQESLLHEEMLALASQNDGVLSLTKTQLKAWVKDKFDATLIRDVSSDRFLADAGRAGRETELALLKGDPAEAFRQKQRQFLAFSMATDAKKLEKIREQFDKTAKRFSAREIPSIEQDYTNFIHDILLKTGNQIKRSVQDLQESIERGEHKTLEEFVDYKQTHDMREIPVAEYLFDSKFQKNLDALTTEEFRALNDSVKTLAKNGRDEKKINKAGEEADLDQIKSQMIEQLAQFKEKHYDASGGRWLGPIPPSVAKPLRTYMVSHLQLESIFNRWDRGDPRGVFTQYVARELATAANYEAALERKFSRALSEIADKADLKERIPNQIIMDPNSGTPIIMTRKNLRAVLMNLGNDSNFAKFAKGYAQGLEIGEAGKLQLEVFKTQIRAWADHHATKEDWQWAQKIGDLFAEIKKDADVMYRGLTGVEPENIHIEPIQTPHGETKGWYYPIIYHPVWEGASRKLMSGDALEQDNYHRATTPRGYTKERTGYSAPMALDLDMLPVRMRQMLHDIAFRPAVIEAGKIFYDKDVRSAITKHYGAEYTKMLVPYLRDVANAANYRNDASQMFTRVSEFARQNVIATLIGLNPGTVLKHGPTAAVNSITEVGAMNFARAVKGLFSINEQTGETNWKYAMETSEELQRRHRMYRETLGGAANDLQDTHSLRDTMIRLGSYPVAMSDLLSAVPTWMAKYESEMRSHSIHGDAVFEADRAVRRAHGSSVITNRPQVMRTGPLGSWFASLYGFFNHIMNRQYELTWRAGETLDLVKEGEYSKAMAEVPKISGMLFSYVLFPALVEEMVTPLVDDKHESWGKKAAKGLAYSLSSSWIGVRDVASAILNGRDPSMGLLSTAGKTITDAARDLNKDRPMSKEKAGALIQHGITALGTLTGIPNAAEGKAARFIHGVATGQEKPRGPWGWMVGLRYGRLKGHSQTFEQYMKGH